jgi:hypothetical protein
MTLTVPSEYVEDFRAAIVEELALDTGNVQELRAKVYDPYEQHAALAAQDLRGAIRFLAQDAALFDQLHAADGTLEPDSDAETLAQTCETMARKIVGAELDRQLRFAPIDAAAAERLRDVMARLSWAIDNAARLHDVAVRERKPA